MTRPLQRRPDGTLEEPEQQQAAPPPAPADRMLQLQQGAGNAALARVLAREPAAGAPIQLTAPGVPSPWSINPATLLPQLKPEVKRAVDAYLERQSGAIRSLGTPMPILIDEIRRNVPEAADADPNAIKDRVYAIVPGVPATRAGASLGQKKAEQEASIANRFPKPPTSVTVGNAQTYVKVEIVSAELKTPTSSRRRSTRRAARPSTRRAGPRSASRASGTAASSASRPRSTASSSAARSTRRTTAGAGPAAS